MIVTMTHRYPTLVSLALDVSEPQAIFKAKSYRHAITIKVRSECLESSCLAPCRPIDHLELLVRAKQNSCFAGFKNEYVVAGSDNDGVFVWSIPEEIRDQPGPPGKYVVMHVCCFRASRDSQ